jgi:hypothetical protein
MDRERAIRIGLVSFSLAAVLGLIGGSCIGKSAADREELNMMHNTFNDFANPTQENLQVRRLECVDIDFKAAKYARAGASIDEINHYHAVCRTVRE